MVAPFLGIGRPVSERTVDHQPHGRQLAGKVKVRALQPLEPFHDRWKRQHLSKRLAVRLREREQARPWRRRHGAATRWVRSDLPIGGGRVEA